MSDQSDANGWAPPDPGPGRSASPEPPPQAQQPEPQQPQGWQEPYAGQNPQQPPPYPVPYGQPQGNGQPPQYGQAPPYAPHPAPYGQAPSYGQSPQGYPPYGYPQYGPPQVKQPWIVPPEPGRPFHQMARTAAHRWWRPLVGTLAILAAGLGLMMVLMIVGTIVQFAVTGEAAEPADGEPMFGSVNAELAFNLAGLAVFLPLVLLAAWGIQRRRPGTLSSVTGRLRWRWLLVCAGLAVLFCIAGFGASLLASMVVDDPADEAQHWVGWGEFLLPAAIILLLVPFQASAEEYMFRGWILQGVGACTLENSRGRFGRAMSRAFRTPWPGMVVGAALFTSGHGYTGWGVLDIFAFGVIAAWITVRSGGLEAAIALHVFNNLMAFLLPAAVGRLDLEQGDVPWQYVIADVVPMLLYAAAVSWLVRRKKIQNVVPDPAAVAVASDGAPADGPPANTPPPDARPTDTPPADDMPTDVPPADSPPLSPGSAGR
ncbi:CPBP family intramembrane glutamic endopeptidase [Actinomadura hibisca]|uniref:CPBP family intramembrane glutamic endopeptidase n=1 Tax=Actinomadura hibisca TaxID=68565 RepID=UPI000A9233A5|nr:CPBP family intramembrane glutamic endopeptidase [Actinomadura hibisca]